MNQRDIDQLMAGIGPVLRELVQDLVAPIGQQLVELRKRLDELPARASSGELAELAVAQNEIREMVLALPDASAVQALVVEAVASQAPPVLTEQIAAAVDKAVAARPVPKDGVGLAGALKDDEGRLVLTLTDGSVVKIGRVDGEPGKPGLDGLGFDDLDVVDEADAIVIRFARGEVKKEFRLARPTLADVYRGVWRDGGAYKRGDAVTWGGSLFIAQRDTGTKPETGDDWKLAVKRGRDGKDGVTVESRAASMVKLK